MLYHGEIIPFPYEYERKEAKNAYLGYSRTKSNGREADKTLCVALLTVNRMIHQEAAAMLCGRNIWRLSKVPGSYLTASDAFWNRYRPLFRHAVLNLDVRDADQTDVLKSTREAMREIQDRSVHVLDSTGEVNQSAKTLIHEKRMSALATAFFYKVSNVRQMELHTLTVNFENLMCPGGCCRRYAFDRVCSMLGTYGPWCEREGYDDGAMVKVLGLWDEMERDSIRERWDLEVV